MAPKQAKSQPKPSGMNLRSPSQRKKTDKGAEQVTKPKTKVDKPITKKGEKQVTKGPGDKAEKAATKGNAKRIPPYPPSPSPSHSGQSGPHVASGMKLTERFRAIVNGLNAEYKQKKLEAVKKKKSASLNEEGQAVGKKKRKDKALNDLEGQGGKKKDKALNEEGQAVGKKKKQPPVNDQEAESSPPRKKKAAKRDLIMDYTLPENRLPNSSDNEDAPDPVPDEVLQPPAIDKQPAKPAQVLRKSPRRVPPNITTSRVSSRQSNYPQPPPLQPAKAVPAAPAAPVALAAPAAPASSESNEEDAAGSEEADVSGSEQDNDSDSEQHNEAPVGDQMNEAAPVARKSIRCKASRIPAEGTSKNRRKTRSVACGAEVQRRVRALGGRKIQVEYAPEHGGPNSVDDHNLLVHEIGSAVRGKMPMDAASFYDNLESNMKIIFNHLSTNFVIDEDPSGWMWKYVKTNGAAKFRSWKHECKAFFLSKKDEVPEEFEDRLTE